MISGLYGLWVTSTVAKTVERMISFLSFFKNDIKNAKKCLKDGLFLILILNWDYP